jgi:hypothetical protein
VRRSYEGAAQAAQLTLDLGGSTSDLVIYCDNLTNWPTGTGDRPFFVVIDRGKATEEKILCASRSANVLTIFDDGLVNGRAADDTSITVHTANSVIEHVFTATDADEANAHVNATTGVHGISGSVVGTTSAQTLTNKTLTSPTINGGTLTSPTITDGNISGSLTGNITMTGGSISGATSISAATITVTGSQTLASYRARNTYVSTDAPSAGSGNDGDLWVQYNA